MPARKTANSKTSGRGPTKAPESRANPRSPAIPRKGPVPGVRSAALRRIYQNRPDLWSTNKDLTDPASGIPTAPPFFGRPVIPHVMSFAGLVTTISRTYRSPDEAIKNSLDNARYMRNDLMIMECLEQRQRATALLDWHLDVDGPKMPKHEALKAKMTRIVKKTRRFTEYRRWLMEAPWFGRVAIQNQYRWNFSEGGRDLVIDRWMPINGDKLAFRQDDGQNNWPEDQVGIRINPQVELGQLTSKRQITSTELGLVTFLSPQERECFVIHKHMIEDAAYEDPLDAGAIHGVGIRSRIYWSWFQKQELLALLMEYLERVALGFEIWYYPEGNEKARKDLENTAKNRVGRRNVIMFPKPLGEESESYGVDQKEPGGAGVDAILGVITNIFQQAVKRYILGQTLSSEASATGLGSGVADLQYQTLLDIVKYDATNLEETLTDGPIANLKRWNCPEASNVDVFFKINTQTPDVEQKLSAMKQAYEMNARLKESDVLDTIGASIPGEGDVVLQRSQVEDAARAAGGMGGGRLFGGGPGDDRPDPSFGDELRDALREQSEGAAWPDNPNR